MKKGFFLTLDALFALTIISFTAWFAFISVDSPWFTTDWFLAARDLTVSGIDDVSFTRFTGLRTTTPEVDAAYRIRAAYYRYPIVCEGQKSFEEKCLSENDALLAQHRFEAWVGP